MTLEINLNITEITLCASVLPPKSNLLLLLSIIAVAQSKSVSWNLFWCPRSHLKNCLPLCDRQRLRWSSFTSKCPKTSSWPLTLGSIMAIASSLSVIKALLVTQQAFPSCALSRCAMPVDAVWQSMGSAEVPRFSLQEEGWWTWFDEGLMHSFFTHTLTKVQVDIILLHLG